jgi:beta-glucosidase
LIDEAVAAAQAAEVALLFVALPPVIESEGYDRPNMDLTAQQVALIKAVTAVQPNTVVILNTGSAVAMTDWLEGTAAVLQAWFMGQGGAGAIADILFGQVNPSGKLAETFPLKLSDNPAHLNYPGAEGVVRYGEGLFIGYRYYDAKEMPVLFPFGHGLSYTTFEYSNPQVSAATFRDVDGVIVSVDVTNTGRRAGQEIVQLYVHDHESGLVRPPKELKGFAKVNLAPGETQTVTMPLDFRAFAFYHSGHKQWITEDGRFDLLIGASAADIRCRETVTLESTLDLPCLLDEESTMREWLNDPRGKVVFEPVFQQIVAQIARGMAGESEGEQSGAIGTDMVEGMMDMPPASVLHWQDSLWSETPEAIIAGLLNQLSA